MSTPLKNPFYELSQFVGDYSQIVESCSYNQETVRALWNNRALDTNTEHNRATIDSTWPEMVGKDFQEEMTRLVKAAGVWPGSWLSHPIKLTTREHWLAGLELDCHGDMLLWLIFMHPDVEEYQGGFITECFYRIVTELPEGSALSVLVKRVETDKEFLSVKLQAEAYFEANPRSGPSTRKPTEKPTADQPTFEFVESTHHVRVRNFLNEWMQFCIASNKE